MHCNFTRSLAATRKALAAVLVVLLLLCVCQQVRASARHLIEKAALTGLAARQTATAARGGLRFERNDGQTDSSVDYVVRAGNATYFLSPARTVVSRSERSTGVVAEGPNASLAVARHSVGEHVRHSTSVAIRLAGADPGTRAEPLDELAGMSNYLIGNDPARWQTGVPSFGRIAYRGVYPGVDQVFYSTDAGELEYDFVVAPYASTTAISFDVEGAEDIRIDRDGNLTICTRLGEVVQKSPRLYQSNGTERRHVTGAFRRIDRDTIGFAVGDYDRSSALVIDPVFAYSTYLGGSTRAIGDDVAVGSSGEAVVVSTVEGLEFPTTIGAFQTVRLGLSDSAITKLSADGSTLVFSTYLGGNDQEQAGEVAVDASGNIYVTGTTSSVDFPTLTPFQPTNAGNGDGYVTKLDSTGAALLYSSYLGGPNYDGGQGIVVDSANRAVISGFAGAGFPVVNPLQTFAGGDFDAFLAIVGATGSTVGFATFLGGSNSEFCRGVAVNTAGTICVAGSTFSSDFPTVNALQPTSLGYVGFVAKYAPDGASVEYATYFGGTIGASCNSVALDAAGNAYFAGDTAASDLPLVDPVQGDSPFSDAFVSVLNSAGSGLLFSTYLGGNGFDRAEDLALDGAGNVYVGIFTESSDHLLVRSVEPDPDGFDGDSAYTDTVVFKIGADHLVKYSTYVGGISSDQLSSLAVDVVGNAYIAGSTQSVDYPTTSSSFQPMNQTGGEDESAFVTKISDLDAGCSVACPPDLTTSANSHIDTVPVAANLDLPDPVLVGSCSGAGARILGPADRTFVVGQSPVLAAGENDQGVFSVCRFYVTVADPFGVCLRDDRTADTFRQVVDGSSPLFGFWVYYSAADELYMSSTATSTRYYPGRTLVTFDRTSRQFVMNATINYASGVGTVRVVDRARNRTHALRDRNIYDDLPCL